MIGSNFFLGVTDEFNLAAKSFLRKYSKKKFKSNLYEENWISEGWVWICWQGYKILSMSRLLIDDFSKEI